MMKLIDVEIDKNKNKKIEGMYQVFCFSFI